MPRSRREERPFERLGRGSPVAARKRAAARHFNDMLGGAAKPSLDGRTAKRRLRLLAELKSGAARGGKKELKPIDILLRVQALLDLGESLASIKKVCGSRRAVPPNDEVVDGVRRLQEAYSFAPEVYRFVGIDEATLRRAGVMKAGPKRNGVKKAGARKSPRTGLSTTGTRDASQRRGAARARAA